MAETPETNSPANDPARIDAAALGELDLERRRAARLIASPQQRLYAGLLSAACAALLAIAAWLTPDARGMGTHQQLGLAPCGMIATTGLPCPTCGMTTAFAYTVRGQWLHAFLAQPGGWLLAIIVALTALGGAWVAIRGRWLPIRMPFITPFWLMVGLTVWLVGGWAFKLAYGLATGALPAQP